MRATSFLLVATTAVAIYVVVAMPTAVLSQYEWYPLPVVSAPRVQELGDWAVLEHDKKANDRIKFRRVVSGEEREDPQLGMKYHFIIDATDGSGKDRRYDAVLAEQVWKDTRILISFKPAS